MNKVLSNMALPIYSHVSQKVHCLTLGSLGFWGPALEPGLGKGPAGERLRPWGPAGLSLKDGHGPVLQWVG